MRCKLKFDSKLLHILLGYHFRFSTLPSIPVLHNFSRSWKSVSLSSRILYLWALFPTEIFFHDKISYVVHMNHEMNSYCVTSSQGIYIVYIHFQCRIKIRPSVKEVFGISENEEERFGGEGERVHASTCDIHSGKHHLFCLCKSLHWSHA